jgi:glycosyltransferase involved in cell wall biosynthesis
MYANFLFKMKLLFIIYYLLFIIYYLLFIIYYLLFIIYYLSFGVWYVVMVKAAVNFLFVFNSGIGIASRLELFSVFFLKGYKVHLVIPGVLDGSVKKKLEDLGCIIHPILLSRSGLNPYKDLKAFFYLRKIIKEIHPVGVFSYTIKPVIYGSIAASFEGIAIRAAMISGLGYVFLGQSSIILSWIIKKLYRYALGKSTCVFFQNNDDKKVFLKSNLIDGNKCTIVNGSGVNLKHFGYIIPPPVDMGIHFVLIARLLGDKGIREYARAAQLLKRRYEKVYFHLVGWIDELNPAAIKQRELDAWVTSGDVIFHGKLDDVRPILKASHVNVLPSYREGVPRTSLEAMAIGRPIVTTDAPGCKETVREGYNGFLVPVKSINALAEAMACFIEQPEQIEIMGRNSRLLVEERYDVHQVNEVIVKRLFGI